MNAVLMSTLADFTLSVVALSLGVGLFVLSALACHRVLRIWSLLKAQAQTRVAWEYQTVIYPDQTIDEGMVKEGSKGWEAISFRRAIDGKVAVTEVIFKRLERSFLPV